VVLVGLIKSAIGHLLPDLCGVATVNVVAMPMLRRSNLDSEKTSKLVTQQDRLLKKAS
jgi:hypothetical protein